MILNLLRPAKEFYNNSIIYLNNKYGSFWFNVDMLYKKNNIYNPLLNLYLCFKHVYKLFFYFIVVFPVLIKSYTIPDYQIIVIFVMCTVNLLYYYVNKTSRKIICI